CRCSSVSSITLAVRMVASSFDLQIRSTGRPLVPSTKKHYTSCQRANETVGARNIFTEQDDGLIQQWFGNVFMNPPYGKDGLASQFCVKAIEEYEAGRATQAVLLVNSLHSQKWQAPLFKFPICLVNHRIEFIDAEGRVNPNPTMQNMFVYLGDSVGRFAEVFSDIGYVNEFAAQENALVGMPAALRKP
ncbi:MAG: DNA N-6-adenine-methyltransferase, partial [Gammaproteobacteria bacterium]